MALPGILRTLRTEKNVSQKTVADFIGITRQAIAAYELGKREPDYEVLNKLADYYGVTIDFLLGRGHSKSIDARVTGRNIYLIDRKSVV